MRGTRRDNPEGRIPSPGEYGKDRNGDWWGCAPNGEIANLSKHGVVEHDDGSITVSPSIGIMSPHDHAHFLYHGYLERGVWRSC